MRPTDKQAGGGLDRRRFTAVSGVAVGGLLAATLAPAKVRAQQVEGKVQGQRLFVCSTTQIADFAKQLVGDRWQVRSVLAAGQDPHLYEVKTGDARLVAQADLCGENGWHLEGHDWMRKLAQDANKPLVTCVEHVEPLVLKEGEQAVHDPHAWFSPKNASRYVESLMEGFRKADPEHASRYAARAELYQAQLRVLHLWILKQCNAIVPAQRRLVTSHDAFNYFCRAYGFVSAAPSGWSTGKEIGGGVTASRRREAVDSIRKHGVKAIFVESSVNPKMVQEIARDAGVTIGGELYSDSMGAVGTAGETYLGMMRENVLTIVEALK